MPELPEVETVARALQRSIAGRRVLSVTLRMSDFIDDAGALERELPGRTIALVERYGKFMLLRLRRGGDADAANEALLVHLGMTGNLSPFSTEQPLHKHTHVILALDDGRELRYTDPRRFGRMAYLAGSALERELQRFGAEPLQVPERELAQRLQSSHARVKALLLDQRVLRGVGNIYADESLWSARIHPARIGSSLKDAEIRELHQALRKILRHAIRMRGSSISDFVDPEGIPGDYQRRHRAYGREGKECHRCATPIRRMIVAGRSTFYCPSCQRAPRPKGKAKRKAGRRTSKR